VRLVGRHEPDEALLDDDEGADGGVVAPGLARDPLVDGELPDAAKELRDARPEARARGFSATVKEKRRFAAVMRALDGAGASTGRLIASRDAAGAKVRFEVRLSDLEAFASALRKAAKG
jgi:hypothetical protein